MAKKPLLDPLLDEVPPPPVAAALAALHLGTASEDQQMLGLDWIVRHACRAFSSTFDADPTSAPSAGPPTGRSDHHERGAYQCQGCEGLGRPQQGNDNEPP
jgi:hypothetical protein